ncbi:MAG TPA: asparagine synthase (glutamine-hydrolyzing) [Verrucomicrobiae bacterium]|nr:asparagine synthase (glutamine-hydrolyzing) [Verrucomicrobiae bacterium]
MCAIAGFFDPRQSAAKVELERAAFRMASAVRHRGPDDEGTWADARAGVAFGHRRLAVLDLSREGHQPMHSADGRYVLIFNGEIYNFQSLRRQLLSHGQSFRGHSDTEVLLAGFCEWGVVPTLQQSVGMFAMAAWDRQSRWLHLARDRAGEKPLYYGWAGGVFMFGSELKALRAHPCWEADIDPGAVALLTRYGYIPAPYCIYRNIRKLLPGSVLTLPESALLARQTGQPEPFWSLQKVAEAAMAQPFQGTENEATQRFHSLLLDSVRQQMVADVPLGAFLSGGIDSTLVVSLMQAQSRRPVKTFCIGFHQSGFDEAPFAKAVARHLETDHTEIYVRPDDLMRVIPRLPAIYDEPFADSSQIPTVLLCELARTQVTVSLSGDAGDELFGGYADYRKAQLLWPLMSPVPASLRGGLARALGVLSGSALLGRIQPAVLSRLLARLENLSKLLPSRTDRAFYRLLMSPNREPLDWLQGKEELPTQFDSRRSWEGLPDFLRRMMYLDFVSYLPDDILVKVDRAAMAASLETRIPLLNHRVVEFAWSLPNSFKQRQRQGKWLLRRVLDQYVPRSLIERPKKGFNVPLGQWLRGPLRDWAEDLLSSAKLNQAGFFHDQTVRRKWMELLDGSRDWGLALWHVLMFQAWLDQRVPSPPCAGAGMVPGPGATAGLEKVLCQS